MHQRSTSSRRFFRALAALTGVLTLLTVTAGAALAASSISSMTQEASSTGDLNSGATEWSGATYNADRNVLLTVDDEFNAFEFDLNPDGSIDASEDVRVLTIALGASDYEGVAWISGDRYALLSEGTGVAYIVDVPTATNTIQQSDIVWQFNAGGPDGNTGSEGIAVGSDGSFYVTDEMPSSLSKYTSAGVFVAEVLLPELGDASGVVVAEDDTFIVISDNSAKASHFDITWDPTTGGGTRVELDYFLLTSFPQVEGIAMIGNEQLHIFGELKGGQTYSHRVGEIVASPQFDFMDVNCSGTSDVVDALIITQIEVGTSQHDPACGSGDSNNDGNLNVVDALMITQCEVGIANAACPDA